MKQRLLVLTALAALGAAPAAQAQTTHPASKYGVCAHHASDAALDKTARAGIKWVRLDFNWFQMETAKGQFNWRITDRLVRSSQAKGLSVFATLAYTPSWANGSQDHAVPPTRMQDWYDFVHAVVTRYKATVKHWGLWNEPNLDHFFKGNRDTYLEILRRGHAAVKAADSAGKTLGPELAHLKGGQWNTWLDDILRRGGQYIDIITHHMYKDPSETFTALDGSPWPWDPPSVKTIIQRAGQGNKPVWFTEFGWRTDQHSPATQARRLKELLEGLEQRPWITKYFPYMLHDGPTGEKWGLMDHNLNHKPGMDAYRDHIRTYTTAPPPPPPPPPPPGSQSLMDKIVAWLRNLFR